MLPLLLPSSEDTEMAAESPMVARSLTMRWYSAEGIVTVAA